MNSPSGPYPSHSADDLRRAADPTTPPEVLAQLADDHESLWAWISANPSAYPGLREWIAEQSASSAPAYLITSLPQSPRYEPAQRDPLPPASGVHMPVVAPHRTGVSMPVLVTLLVGALVVLGGAVAAVIIVTTMNAQQSSFTTASADADVDDSTTLTDEPTDDPSQTPTPSPTPTPTATPLTREIDSRIPSCDQMYSPGYASVLTGAGMTLTSGWIVSSPAGTADAELAQLLSSTIGRECRWHGAQGGDAGIETTVAGVAPEVAVAATARLAALGYKTVNELGGTRYFLETKNSAGVKFGESHIIRDGLWFATRWIEYGPPGYTADIVTRVLG